jgi:hypothetical protein
MNNAVECVLASKGSDGRSVGEISLLPSDLRTYLLGVGLPERAPVLGNHPMPSRNRLPDYLQSDMSHRAGDEKSHAAPAPSTAGFPSDPSRSSTRRTFNWRHSFSKCENEPRSCGPSIEFEGGSAITQV